MRSGVAPKILTGLAALITAAAILSAQPAPETKFWAARPVSQPHYSGANRPLVRLSDLVRKRQNETRWSEVVFADAHLHGAYISAPPGDRVAPRFHPDTRIYWVVFDGRIRFNIEGQPPLVASKGSMVQAPKQTIYSMETVGDAPSVRLEVTIPGANTVFVQDSAPAAQIGLEWLLVGAPARKPAPYDHGNQPHINLFELLKDPAYGDTFFVDGDNEIAHIVCVYAKDKPPILAGDRGHYHAEGA